MHPVKTQKYERIRLGVLIIRIMASRYTDQLHALYKLEFFGMKLGLENITRLLEYLGRPDREFPSIHVAGTNGKGSVSAMLAAVHRSAGKKTGLYTSPHLVDFRERIRIDGQMISEAEVLKFLERVWPKVEEIQSTFFEVTTAMAFDHFARHKVDIAIIETGLGGRLDATNALERPLATVITSIGYDHMAQLGPTLESIAGEKAGIFKHGVPAVVNCKRSLEPVFRERAKKVGAPISFVRERKAGTAWPVPFAGEHQKKNVATVQATLAVLPYRIPASVARRGVRNTAELTGLRGRLERIDHPELTRRKIKLIVDVGHNPQAIEAIGKQFAARQRKPIVVAGLMKDKDIPEVLRSIGKFASTLVAVRARSERALPSETLHEAAQTAGLASVDGGSVMEGLEHAFTHARRGDTILLIGSHYVVGEFLENFQRTGEVMKVTK